MAIHPSSATAKQARHSGGLLGSLLIAGGIASLILSSALLFGQGPAAGSEQPLIDSSGAAAEADMIVILPADGPSLDTMDSRLVRLAQPAPPAFVARPPLTLPSQPVAAPIAAPPPTSPSAPVVVPVVSAPTATPVPPPPPVEQPTLPPPPAPTPTPLPPPPPPAQPSTPLLTFEADIFAGVNQERIAAGLVPLRLDGALTAVARERSNDMVAKGYFGHVSPTGETAFSLLDRYGIPYGWAGENLARNNYPDNETVAVSMRDWMASQGHRENILGVHYMAVGVGAAVDSSGMKYFTLVFTGP